MCTLFMVQNSHQSDALSPKILRCRRSRIFFLWHPDTAVNRRAPGFPKVLTWLPSWADGFAGTIGIDATMPGLVALGASTFANTRGTILLKGLDRFFAVNPSAFANFTGDVSLFGAQSLTDPNDGIRASTISRQILSVTDSNESSLLPDKIVERFTTPLQPVRGARPTMPETHCGSEPAASRTKMIKKPIWMSWSCGRRRPAGSPTPTTPVVGVGLVANRVDRKVQDL